MKDEFEVLLKLNKLDIEVFELKKTNANIPHRIQDLNDEINKEQNILDEILINMEQSSKEIKLNQENLEMSKTSLNNDEECLKDITTNREYDAIHEQMSVHRKMIEDSETNILRHRNLVDSLQKGEEKIKITLAEIKEKNVPLLEKLQLELSNLESCISEIENRFEVSSEYKKTKIFNLYTRIISKKKKPYIISLLNWDNRTCQICQKMQPTQKISAVNKQSDPCLCETCGSFLIWDDRKLEKCL